MKRTNLLTGTIVALFCSALVAQAADKPKAAKGSTATRTEHDLLGDKQVPADALYGVQTARALENFQISPVLMNSYPEFIQGFAIVKLAVSPIVCLVVVRGLDVAEPFASVAVLQSAMPTAMASVIVAAKGGCDRSLAAGVATLTTLLCLISLPAIGWLLALFP